MGAVAAITQYSGSAGERALTHSYHEIAFTPTILDLQEQAGTAAPAANREDHPAVLGDGPLGLVISGVRQLPPWVRAWLRRIEELSGFVSMQATAIGLAAALRFS